MQPVARLWQTPSLGEIVAGARFLLLLPSFLREEIDPEQARTTLKRRLDQREADFLSLARRAIYANPRSPYRRLLALAGCQYDDLERLVNGEGVEGALRALYRQGVYLTVDEFKGRCPVVRGSARFTIRPDQLRNPRSAAHLVGHTSGSRGLGSPVPINLANMRDRAITKRVALEARGGSDWLQAYYGAPSGGVLYILEYAVANFSRWFSPTAPDRDRLHRRARWVPWALHSAGLLAGVSLPQPEFVPPDGVLRVVDWMAEVLRAGRVPHLWCYTSFAVRVCQAAVEAGIDLSRAQFTLGGEPTTATRLTLIQQAGAEALPTYGSIDSGVVGYGCLSPNEPDEVHLFSDLHALVQPESDAEPRRLPPGALLISSLRSSAPLILLNVSLGDQAVLAEGACGCPLERCGWTMRLHSIRSFEKLTAAGVAFLDGDVVTILEETLPARFGGGPTDYQLVEEEGADGQSRLRLMVHPALGPLDAEVVADAFLSALAAGSEPQRVMAAQWRQLGLLRVEREPPHLTGGGKILHLHQQQPSARP